MSATNCSTLIIHGKQQKKKKKKYQKKASKEPERNLFVSTTQSLKWNKKNQTADREDDDDDDLTDDEPRSKKKPLKYFENKIPRKFLKKKNLIYYLLFHIINWATKIKPKRVLSHSHTHLCSLLFFGPPSRLIDLLFLFPKIIWIHNITHTYLCVCVW